MGIYKMSLLLLLSAFSIKTKRFIQAKIDFGGRTLNDLHLKFTATGNNNLSDQFKIDVLATIIQWGGEKSHRLPEITMTTGKCYCRESDEKSESPFAGLL